MVSIQAEPSKGGQPQQDEVGANAVDPTKNVLDLVKAESKFQDGMRDAESRAQTAALVAEIKRLDNLATQKREYEIQIAGMLRVSVEERSLANRKDLDTLGDRLTKLEQFRYENSGKSSVADPALATALESMAASIKALNSTGDKSEGGAKGRDQIWGYIIGALGALGVISTIAFTLIRALAA